MSADAAERTHLFSVELGPTVNSCISYTVTVFYSLSVHLVGMADVGHCCVQTTDTILVYSHFPLEVELPLCGSLLWRLRSLLRFYQI